MIALGTLCADPPRNLRYNTAMIVRYIGWCENCATNQMVHWAFAVFSLRLEGFPSPRELDENFIKFLQFFTQKFKFFFIFKNRRDFFVRNSIIMKFIWDLLLCKCKTLQVNAEVNRWPLLSLAQPNAEGLFGLLICPGAGPSLKKLREIFQCDFSLENHKNESLIMRDSLRAQLWAWQSYRPEYIYIYTHR